MSLTLRVLPDRLALTALVVTLTPVTEETAWNDPGLAASIRKFGLS